MATTSRIDTVIKNNMTVLRVPAYASETYYHGAFAFIDGDGYVRNATSSIYGIKGAGVLKSEYFDDSTTIPKSLVAGSTSGNINDNVNCLDLYIDGEVEADFDSLAQRYVGAVAYIKDNATLTVDVNEGLYPIGRVTKYISSTKGAIMLNNLFGVDNENLLVYGTWTPATTKTYQFSIANPFGHKVVVKDAAVRIATAAASAVTGSLCISATSASYSAGAGYLISSGGVAFGTAGYYSIGTCTSSDRDGSRDLIWTSSNYVVLLSTGGTSSGVDGYVKLVCQKL